jgi:hypothetical protein
MKLSGGPLPTSSTQKPASAAVVTAIAGHGSGRMSLISCAEGTSTETSAATVMSPAYWMLPLKPPPPTSE